MMPRTSRGPAAALVLGLAAALVLPALAAGQRTIPDRPVGVRAGITPISSVNANGAGGLSPLEFTEVTVRGVVQRGTGVVDPFDRATPSNWFWVADGTGGLAIAHPGVVGTSVATGDSVEVTSIVFTQGAVPIRGTRTLDLGVFGTGTITVIGSGVVEAAAVVSAAEIATNGAAWEGTRVRIADLTVVDPGEWPGPGASAFVRVTDGTTILRMYVDDDTDLDEGDAPVAAFDLVGFVAQDAATFTGNHFVWPGGLADLISGDGSGTATVTPSSVVAGQTDVSLRFRIRGQEATLETVELAIPAGWTWAAPGDLAVSGDGFASATVGWRDDAGTTVVEVTGAEVTATADGFLDVGSLTAPSAIGESTFLVRTATLGGTPTPIPSSPIVRVITEAFPGDVVINEIYAVTIAATQGREVGEFVEIRNVTAAPLDVSGWTLADFGRTAACVTDSRWAFPAGTVLTPGGFAVVCRTANDAANREGFLRDFPAFVPGPDALLFETYDAGAETPSMDDPATPNMILRDPTSGNDQMILLGGAETNAGQCVSPNVPGRLLPFSELIVLRDATGQVIDAFEYREAGPCEGDYCDDGVTGPNDAYAFGPPKLGNTLGRDAASTDTDDSGADLLPSSTPTPGAVNVPGDTDPPTLVVEPSGAALSAAIVEIRWDEPVDPATGTDPMRFGFTVPATGDSLDVLDVLADPEQPGRHFYLVTEPLPPGSTVSLHVSGVTDLVIGGAGGNATDTTAAIAISRFASTICTVQEFDESGFSPSAGDTVTVAGQVTLGTLPPFTLGTVPPFDRVSIWVQEPGGCGVNVFSFTSSDSTEQASSLLDIARYGVQLNDFVVIQGRVTEFVSTSSGSGAVTEIEALPGLRFLRFLLRGLEGPAPVEVTTAAANDEALEGTLLHTQGTAINANALAVWIDDGSGAVQIFQNFSSLDLTRFRVGDRIDVTGILTQFDSSEPYFSGYELVPQSQETVFTVDGGFASDGPVCEVERRVLVPDLGERIRIRTVSPRRSDVIVEIYDAVGRRVTTLYDGIGLGRLDIEWDGTAQDGTTVDPGVYYCHVRCVGLDGGSVRTDSAPIVVGLRLDGE